MQRARNSSVRCQQLLEVADHMTKLTATIQHLSVGGGTAPPLCLENSPLLAKPEKYDGNPAHGKGFLLQCKLYLASCENLSEHQEIVNIISLLIGKALTWATVLWKRKGEATKDYNRFLATTLQKERKWVNNFWPSNRAIREWQDMLLSFARWQRRED